MKALLIIAAILWVFVSGCATHYHRIRGNEITLILIRPQAKQVVFACSLDGFKARSAKKVSGRWEVTLPLGAAFKYFYQVDGVLFLPECPLKEDDDFGSENCIFDPQM